MFVGLPELPHERIELRAGLRGLFTRPNSGLAEPSGVFTHAIRSLAEGNSLLTRVIRGLAGGDGALPRAQSLFTRRVRLLRRRRWIPCRFRVRRTHAIP